MKMHVPGWTYPPIRMTPRKAPSKKNHFRPVVLATSTRAAEQFTRASQILKNSPKDLQEFEHLNCGVSLRETERRISPNASKRLNLSMKDEQQFGSTISGAL